MARPQTGILPEGNAHAIFLTLVMNRDGSHPIHVRHVCAGLPALTARVAALDPAASLVSVVGIGAWAWDDLYPGRRPAGLKPFPEIRGNGRHAPSTEGDILLHIRSDRHDLNFELARRAMAAFGDSVSVIEEVHGFRYLDARDLTGFVDGTENPEGEERAEVALVGEDDRDFAAGSYISMQRYVHDLDAWERLEQARQERVIGRTKPDDRELGDGEKPPTAHISRVVIRADGEELEILRHSMPYGTATEAGLCFIAYGRTPENFNRMLRNMLEADTEGHYDHLMDYTRAVSGVAFFAPSLDFLEASPGGS